MMHEDEIFDFIRKSGIIYPLTPMYKLLRVNLN